MLEKNVILAMTGIVVALVAFLGYAIYRKYPEPVHKHEEKGVEQ